MRILLKCPTRGRREKFLDTIRTWVSMATRTEAIGIAVSVDADDVSMRGFTEDDLPNVAWKRVFVGTSKTKIEACNADMDKIEWDWDIVILVSDDMIPQKKGYDVDIIEAMNGELDRVVWIYDGLQNSNLNTLNIFGRKRYEAWGYLYNPVYKSFYCDNEVTDWCRANPHKCAIIREVLIRHVHHLVTNEAPDALYTRNAVYLEADRRIYEARTHTKKYGFLNLLSRR